MVRLAKTDQHKAVRFPPSITGHHYSQWLEEARGREGGASTEGRAHAALTRCYHATALLYCYTLLCRTLLCRIMLCRMTMSGRAASSCCAMLCHRVVPCCVIVSCHAASSCGAMLRHGVVARGVIASGRGA